MLLNGHLTVQPFYNMEGDVGGGSGASEPTSNSMQSGEGNVQPTQQTENTGVNTGVPDTTKQPVNEIDIDGFGRVKIDELKEWKNGYMRQSDLNV
jgi:hypothetical protein